MLNKIKITEKFDLFKDYWNPRVIAEFNNQHVRIAKLKGEFVWHKHDTEDELFYIIKGTLCIAFENYSVNLSEGEMIIIPKGTIHKPIAEEEVHVILIEPVSTLNTGDAAGELTRHKLESI